MRQEFETGMAVGHKHFARITAKGSRWQSRNVPAYIRQHLMVPYYYTHDELANSLVLWVIQSPIDDDEKVHFVRFAHDLPHEENEVAGILDRSP